MRIEMLTLPFIATTVCVERSSVGLRAYRDAGRQQLVARRIRNVLTKSKTLCATVQVQNMVLLHQERLEALEGTR